MTQANNNETLNSILLMVFAMAAFSTGDMLIKVSANHMPGSQVLTVLGLGGTVTFAIIAKLNGLPLLTREALHPAVLSRAASEIVATMGFLMALTLLPFSIASSILQVNPLLVTLGAAVFLSEPVGWKRWSAIFVGLFGVLVILNPGNAVVFSSDALTNLGAWVSNMTDASSIAAAPGAILALIGVIGLSARDLTTRFIPKTTHTLQVAVWGFTGIILAGLLLSLFNDPWVALTMTTALTLSALVGFGVVGYFAITLAMRAGDISAVAPFRYTRIIFAFIFGVVVFGETLTTRTLIGAALIIGAGLYTLFREKRRALSVNPAPVAK